jgi:hypothetical protein
MQQLQDRVVKVGVLRGEAVLEGKLARSAPRADWQPSSLRASGP